MKVTSDCHQMSPVMSQKNCTNLIQPLTYKTMDKITVSKSSRLSHSVHLFLIFSEQVGSLLPRSRRNFKIPDEKIGIFTNLVKMTSLKIDNRLIFRNAGENW